MSLAAGLIGLPNVGKSTLFEAITRRKVLVENYPFATIEPNVGIVNVPDHRLNLLDQIYKPEKVIPTSFRFIDIAGLVKGASTGEGLGNKFLSHIREVDIICHVIRCFKCEKIIHVEGNIDPIRDIEIVNTELMLSDLELLSNRDNKLEKKNQINKEETNEIKTVKRAKEGLEKGVPLRLLPFNGEEKKILKNYNLLTIKPLIYVLNIKEDDLRNEDNSLITKIEEFGSKENAKLVTICAKIESELNELNDSDKKNYLEELGIKESGLDTLVKEAYNLLGLKTFFTASAKEVRAWTFKEGMTVKQCAGIIHSDFEKGFIKADVISYEDIEKYKNEQRVKENGRKRLEGKEYLTKDGDLCHFRFNV
jgi:ribosome-binding ATPase